MKYKITRKNRRGYISPVPVGELQNILYNKMMYIRKGAEFMANPYWAIVELYQKKTGSFPWGFLSKIKNILEQLKIEYEIEGDIVMTPKLVITTGLRDYQIDAVLKLVENNGGILSMPTASGKTKTVISYINTLNVSTLVVVPTLDIKRQWEEQSPNFVKVVTYQSIKKKDQLVGYKLVVFDEVHHVASKVLYKIAMNCNEAILVGCSATAYRDDGEDLKIEASIGKIVYSISKRELIDAGWLCDAEVRYIELSKPEREFLTYQEAYDKFVVNNKERNTEVINIALREAKNKKVLILIQKIEHGLLLYNDLSSKNDRVCFIHGGLNKKIRNVMFDDIKRGNYDITIATSLFDEGVDVPNFEVLVLAVGGKSSVKIVQRVGRLLRLYKNKDKAIIYDFADKFKWLKEHYTMRREILEQDFEVKDWIAGQESLNIYNKT